MQKILILTNQEFKYYKYVPESIVVSKVLELNEGVLAVSANNGLHELVDKVVILLTGHTLVAEADVVDVLEHLKIK